MVGRKLLLSASVVLAIATVAAAAYAAAVWDFLSWESESSLRMRTVLPGWADAAVKLGFALTVYGLIRLLGSDGKAARLIWAGFGVVVLSILARWYWIHSAAEALHAAEAVVDLALAALLLMAALTSRALFPAKSQVGER